MKKWYELLLKRIDALSLRERVFLFACLIVSTMVLADTLWISPAQAAHRVATQRFAAQSVELLRLQEELKAMDLESGPGRTMRRELAKQREQVAVLDQEIGATPVAGTGETPLTEVLLHFLRRSPGLTLVRTATLPPEDEKPGDAGSANGQGAPTLRRQGVELTVAGAYGDLARYVRTLETSLPALRWGAMSLEAEQQPARVTLKVFIVRAVQ